MNIDLVRAFRMLGAFPVLPLFMTFAALLVTTVNAQSADPIVCPSGNLTYLPDQALNADPANNPQIDLKVVGDCLVRPGAGHDYYYGQVNIVDGGQLMFREHDETNQYQEDTVTNFWTSSIIIENGGTMDARSGQSTQTTNYPDYWFRFFAPRFTTSSDPEPYGTRGGTLNIRLYGKDEVVWDKTSQTFTEQNQGALCVSEGAGPCGIPENIWNSNGSQEFNLPGFMDGFDQTDYFYQYGPLRADMKCTNGQYFSGADGTAKCGTEPADGKVGYFGKKVIAVSYGGTLTLAGYKGACTDTEIRNGIAGCGGLSANEATRSSPGWTRLDGDLETDAGNLTLENAFKGAENDDEIIVTTTDYLPGHSELLKINSGAAGKAIGFEQVTPCADGQYDHACFFHTGETFDLDRLKNAKDDRGRERLTIDEDLVNEGAEIRAAVAHMTRSIRIISAGDTAGADFGYDEPGGTEDPEYSFGGQLIARQGIEQFQIQGVEFKQLGQGGRMGHYALHFHKARLTPSNTFIKDSTINVSMTRWIVLHSTNGVDLERNIGYKSIGHGFYLEDGTETDNNLHSNLGIFARAAVENIQNPRNIPGILASNSGGKSRFPFYTDSQFPSVFWITNGWNNFIGNMAAGAGACGAGYWLPPMKNSDRRDVGGGQMEWSGYSEIQKNQAGISPLKSFYMNYATSAMHSLQTTSDAPPCAGIIAYDEGYNPDLPVLKAVESIAPNEMDYYPDILPGAGRVATVCPGDARSGYDCSEIVRTSNRCNASSLPISDPNNPLNICGVTVIDHYTSSFHWAEGNIAAIWLRQNWHLLDNSVLTDVQNGGLTFVSGGDYTHSSVINGFWALARNSIFIGHTQEDNSYASDKGPFNGTDLTCDTATAVPEYCLNSDEGISMPIVAFFTNQRFANIYDGPSYQDSNAYLDINKAECEKDGFNGACMYGPAKLIVKEDGKCYLPNAAIAWKQPNGFYYPPAFHTENLYFDEVDLRHYVINPLFRAPSGVTGDEDFGQGGTYKTDETMTVEEYCSTQQEIDGGVFKRFFDGFTSVDRQTELNDDDGTLTGLVNDFIPQNSIENQLNQTISVNRDLFFAGPVEAPECLSALGENTVPANACDPIQPAQPAPTVTTSPYDYVTAVMYHAPGDPDWSNGCSTPDCYGVPLYRQYLTGSDGGSEANSTRDWAHWYNNGCDQDSEKGKAKCRWPYIRMSGAPTYSRVTLTTNNGSYYVDTTVSKNTQQTEDFTPLTSARKINVFKANERYHMFFVFAKQTTMQTYKFYVGENFDEDTFKLECVDISTEALKFSDVEGSLFYNYADNSDCRTDRGRDWATHSFDEGTGILEVVVDFRGQNDLDPTIRNGLCLPRSFCKPDPRDPSRCTSALAPDNPIRQANPDMEREADTICRKWAVKDLDCPEKGCLGFSFQMPGDFVADDSHHRPDPEPFPGRTRDDGKPGWEVEFERTRQGPDNMSGQSAIGGQCYYPRLPGSQGCPVP